jgi:2-iminobutanoate/2-iminopropanoate deaminase
MPLQPPLTPARSHGDLVFVSGMTPKDPAGAVVEGDVTVQTHAVLGALTRALASEGAALSDVLRVGVYLSDLDDDYDAFNAVYREYFSAPFPARTTIGAGLRGIRVEIDAVAARSAPEDQ